MKKLYGFLLSYLLLCGGCSQNPELAEPTRPGYTSSGLVIEAVCSPSTRTDIHEGKSTWIAGDQITVIYDGQTYTYTAEQGGEVTSFTSTAGISNYDPDKGLTAYYPPTTVDGTVEVATVKTITFATDFQANPAEAPLVGTPLDMEASSNTLKMNFKNIFSVIELRIDAGDLTSTATSLTVEPADIEQFEGYLSFNGTVDPSTLALTPATDGTSNKLTLNFPAETNLSKPQTIKFAVGRFISDAGLKLTLTTADGKHYTKNIYKSGLCTYTENNGKYTAKHLAKAMYAFGNPGGIITADDLIDFANAVNSGASLAPWIDERGVISLLDDIDLAEVTEWTPIGAATYTLSGNKLSLTEGKPFTGYFDGMEHTISNLRLVCKNATSGAAWGLFGAIGSGAKVGNFTLDNTCSLTVSASQATDCGIIAGVVNDATVYNITNHAAMTYNGSSPSDKRVTVGMIGLAFANEGSTIDKLVNNGTITGDSGANQKNGATGLQMAGIVGFSSNDIGSVQPVVISNCTNNGNMDTKAARTSGIVAAANRYTYITDCTNNGNQINDFATASSARLGNITCITGVGCKLIRAINHGDIVCETQGAAGGIVCLVNDDGNHFEACETYGRIITDRENNSYKGTLFGQCNKAATFKNCVTQGIVGMYNGGDYQMETVNADNYFNFVGAHGTTAVNVTTDNIFYYPVGSNIPAESTFSVTPTSATLNATGTNSAVVELSSINYDWTVSSGSNTWISISDLDNKSVSGGKQSPYVQRLRITADANPSTSTRPASITFSSTDKSQSATVTITQEAAQPAFPSKWVFSSSTEAYYASSWTTMGKVPATSGNSGVISVIRSEANASKPFTYTVSSSRPSVSNLLEGDYWLYTFPVESLAAGSYIEFYATMAGEANAPKYYIVEYFDGGSWKSVAEDLHSAAEDPLIRYTYKCTGLSSGSSYQHATVIQVMRFEQAINNSEVKIRCRAVGPYTCSGATLGTSTTTATSSIPQFGFTGAYVQNLGTSVPKESRKVLCLGNSFSYYNSPVAMLQEIAFKEGHQLDISTHLKGSQTLQDHQSLTLSTDAIKQGGYDFAFIQDQSQNPALYARDNTASISTECTALANLIRTSSTSCQVILEQTWAYSGGTYGGFTDYATFDGYLAAGSKAMAQAANAWVSPIGAAFDLVRKGSSGTNLYYTDNKHQSLYGAYLKACVNYLVIYGTAFGATPANCDLEPTKAAYLRSIAEQAVLGHENDYLIQR